MKKPSAKNTAYRNKSHELLDRFSDRQLCKLKPMTRNVAIEFWNEANRCDMSQRVKDHFQRELQRLK